MPFFSTVYIKTYAFLNLLFTRVLAKSCILMQFCLYLFIHAHKSAGELSIRAVVDVAVCVRARFSAQKTSHTALNCLLLQQSRSSYMLALCLRAVLISSPDT